MVKNINDKNAEEEIKTTGVVVVDVYADWCGPCRMLSPVIDELSTSDEYKVFKLDSDVNKDTVTKYGVSSLPTILFFKDGELKDTHVGFTTLEKLKEKIDLIK